ncbi:MAG TPA: alkaline phosphatase [Deltaproteobacteria bacterium]|nr:alkaline phosphatase [Deltaproteobacteria bacterium]
MAIDRRRFLKASALQAVLVGTGSGMAGMGIVGCASHPGAAGVEPGTNPFRHGVASGDPLADRVVLWTRVSPDRNRMREPIEVGWWVSRDRLGSDVVASGRTRARPERDYTVKIDAGGLEPASDYYYGFESPTGSSPTGRTRTLPVGPVDHVRLAFASCANYPQGFFNAYSCIANRDDLDVVLHLGDYLYEYGNGEYGDGTPLGRIPDPIHEAIDLEDYRRRHATYKSDPDLQAAHARFPWITVWDDHESADNAYKNGAENHDADEGDWSTRKLAAILAYHEWMPIRELPTGLFRSFRFGDLVDLVMLDTRLHGRDAQPPSGDDAAARDPDRTLLGDDQTSWLLDRLSESNRDGVIWRVIGQQVVVAPLTGGTSFFNPDSWDGYRENRRQILDHLEQQEIDNVVFLTGDIHSAWAFDIPPAPGSGGTYDPATGKGARAVEFVAPAVSSPPLATSVHAHRLIDGIDERLPHLRYKNLEENGFVLLDLTPERVRAEFVFTDPVGRRSARSHGERAFETLSGSNHLSRQDSPAAVDDGEAARATRRTG